MMRWTATSDRTVVARLTRVFSANLFNQAVTIVVQLALVPVLLITWGTQLYGIWLLLSAVPAYLMFSDFGFTMVAKTRMMMQVNAGDREAATRTFHSVFLLLNAAAPLVLALTIGAVCLIDLNSVLNLHGFPVWQAQAILALLLVNVVCYQYFMLIGAGVRCENRAATEQIWVASSRLSDGAMIGIAAFFSHNLILAAGLSLASRLVFTLAMYAWVRRNTPWLRLGHSGANWGQVRSLWGAASSFMLITVSQALLIQAPVIVIGNIFGPAQVVVFSTARTVARIGTAVSYFLNGSMSAEFSGLYGRRDFSLLARLFRLNMALSAGMATVYGVALFALRDPIMHVFTHGRVHAPMDLFLLLIGAVLGEMMWVSVSSPLMAINRHIRVGYLLTLLSAVAILASFPLGHAFGVNGVAGAVFAVQIAMLLLCLREVRHVPGIGPVPTVAAA